MNDESFHSLKQIAGHVIKKENGPRIKRSIFYCVNSYRIKLILLVLERIRVNH